MIFIIFLLILIITILILYIKFIKCNKYQFLIDIKKEYNLSNKVTRNEYKNLKQGQIIMSEMLKIFNNICKKNNINYWVQAGTLIGTVRHKGWIPWDGDIDISMLINDYNKFKLLINELPSHMVLSEPNDKPCSKIRSKKAIYIPNEYSEDWDWNMGLQIDIFKYNIVNKSNKKIIQGGNAVCGSPGKKEIDYNDIFPLKKLVFENILINVPNKYKKICIETWGNYPPPLPPIDKRYCHEGDIKFLN